MSKERMNKRKTQRKKTDIKTDKEYKTKKDK